MAAHPETTSSTRVEETGVDRYCGVLDSPASEGRRVAPKLAWITLFLQYFFVFMIYLLAKNHFDIKQSDGGNVPYCTKDVPGYLSGVANEADLYPKCKDYNRLINHGFNLFYSGQKQLSPMQSIFVYALALLVLLPWTSEDLIAGWSMINLWRVGGPKANPLYDWSLALYGFLMCVLVLFIIFTNMRSVTWTLQIRGTYLEATLGVLLAVVILDYDEKVWALRLLWQRRSYVKERRRAASQDTVPVPDVA